MKESGQLEKLWSKWKPFIELECFPIKSEAVAFENVVSAFVLLLNLIIVSLIILAIEKIMIYAKSVSRNMYRRNS